MGEGGLGFVWREMSEASFDAKTMAVLGRLYRNLLGRKRPESSCLGCHHGPINYYEASQDKRKDGYCSPGCQIGYYALGHKRVRELEKERPDFTQLLQLLDQPVAAQIIVFSYPAYTKRMSDMRALLNMRKESQQLKTLIDQYIFRLVEKLSRKICEYLTNETLSLFPNLTTLYLASPTNEVSNIRHMTRLVNLEIGESGGIGDDSLIHLQKLTSLLVLGDVRISGDSLSVLTRLESFYCFGSARLTDPFLHLLSYSVTKLHLAQCLNVTSDGFSNRTNLTSLRVTMTPMGDASFSNLSNLESLRLYANPNFIGNNESLRNMPLLKKLVLQSCPNFEGYGLRYRGPLEKLKADSTKVQDFHLAGQIHLTALNISRTNITDYRLSEFTNLTRLYVAGCEEITDASLQRLTLLVFLDLSNCQRVNRSILSKLTNLEKLYLNHTEMRPSKNEPPLVLPKLRSLSLNNTRALIGRDMVQLSSLTYLSLSHNDVIQGRVFMRNLTNLKKLILIDNRVIENDVVEMFTKLESIDLEHNDLITRAALQNMPYLKEIILRDGTVTDDIGFVDDIGDDDDDYVI